MPGVNQSVQMRERVFQGQPDRRAWVWRDIEGTRANVVLDQATRVGGVHVIVVTEPGGRRPPMDRAMAELWLDGRTVDRTSVVSGASGGLNVFITDHDPRTSLMLSAGASADNGRTFPAQFQEPDAVWSVCGERYRQNIQFRLVRYTEVLSTGICANAATRPNSGTPYCIVNWARSVCQKARRPPSRWPWWTNMRAWA